MIDAFEIIVVNLKTPQGIEVYDSSNHYHREDFLNIKQVSIGKHYLFGFNRNLLCRVDTFDADEGSIDLTQILDLDIQDIEITATSDPARFHLDIRHNDLPVPVSE